MSFTTNDQEIIKEWLSRLRLIKNDTTILLSEVRADQIIVNTDMEYDGYSDRVTDYLDEINEAILMLFPEQEEYIIEYHPLHPLNRKLQLTINKNLDKIYSAINKSIIAEEEFRKNKAAEQRSEQSEIELIEIQSQESIREKLDKVKDENRKYISDLTLRELNYGYVIYNFRNPGYVYHDCPHDSAWFISKNAVYCVTSAKEMLLAIKDGYVIHTSIDWIDGTFKNAFSEINDSDLIKILSYKDSLILNMTYLPESFLVEYFNEYHNDQGHEEFVQKVAAMLLAKISQWEARSDEFFINILSAVKDKPKLQIEFNTPNDVIIFAEKCVRLSDKHKTLVPKPYQQAINSQIELNQKQGIDERLNFLSKMAERLSDNAFGAELLRWNLDSLFEELKNEQQLEKHNQFISAYKKLKPNNQSVLSYYLADENIALFEQLSTENMEIIFDQCQNKSDLPDYEAIKYCYTAGYGYPSVQDFFARNACAKGEEFGIIQLLELDQILSQSYRGETTNTRPAELKKLKKLLGEQSIKRYEIYCEKNPEYKAALEIKKAMQLYLIAANALIRFWANPSKESKEFAQNVFNTKENSTILTLYQAHSTKKLGSTMRRIVTELDKNPAVIAARTKQAQ